MAVVEVGRAVIHRYTSGMAIPKSFLNHVRKGYRGGQYRLPKSARRTYRKTGLAKTIAQAEKFARGQRGRTKKITRLLDGIEQAGRSSGGAGDLMQYALGSMAEAALGSFLSNLGPFGKVVAEIVGSPKDGSSLGREIQGAMTFLEALGYTITGPDQQQQQPTAPVTRQPIQAKIAPPPVQPTGRPGSRRPSPRPTPAPRNAPPVIPQDAPPPVQVPRAKVSSVKMRRVTSSNVHSIGYDDQTWKLYVTFLAGGKSRSGAGATYEYSDVSPRLWEGFTSASSKGGWVWDQLRVEGSQHGHQYDYRLAKTSGGYVPRKATPVGMRPRTIRQNKQIYGSKLKGSGKWRGMSATQVARGEPNRGTPNRG